MQGQSGIFQEFQKHIEPQTQEHVMTIAESLIDQGLQQGLQQGRQEGEAALLNKLLKRRFGVDAVERYLIQIREADSEQLSQWGENFIDAHNIEDIFSYLPVSS